MAGYFCGQRLLTNAAWVRSKFSIMHSSALIQSATHLYLLPECDAGNKRMFQPILVPVGIPYHHVSLSQRTRFSFLSARIQVAVSRSATNCPFSERCEITSLASANLGSSSGIPKASKYKIWILPLVLPNVYWIPSNSAFKVLFLNYSRIENWDWLETK